MNVRIGALLIVLGLTSATFAADDMPGKQVEKTFKSEGKDDVSYWLYLPKEYGKGDKTWPVVMFLHGSGESGTKTEAVKKHGPPKMIEAGKEFSFIVVSPQSRKGGWNAAVLHALLDDIEKNYKVDKERVYVTGLSMGGAGTWSTAAAKPERFAAIIPICGGGNPGDAAKLKGLPIRIFQGGKDNAVKPETAERMLKALQDAGAKDVELKLYPNAGHDSWTETYNDDKVWEWLLKQKRGSADKGIK